ncbi:hypothetical protein TrVE_jg6362 [Triparma verrucosa]|uniref:Uncharacterized protein n=1 Tax=Triparma verrucosa TaxID=1606542 RepID=A0A9W7B7K0_9STRA|nr:hypothetical protein TrVE_jg6362 [Triparma verrucosa]
MFWTLVLLLVPTIEAYTPSLLDTFVSADDDYIDYVPLPSLDFSGSGIRNLKDFSWEAKAFNLTSQVWLAEGDWGSTWGDNSQQWWHYMYIITPSNLPESQEFAHLYITGGKNTDVPSATSEDILACADLAMGMRQKVIVLFQVPNFPLWINTDEGPTELLGEDALLANTFVHYMDHVKGGGDPESLPDASFVVLLPMVKSGFAAMAASEVFFGGEKIKWTVSGASKRGWTTWLVGAVDQARPVADQRVHGIVPIVLNGLHFAETLKHQYQCYGGWSWTMTSFVDVGFTSRIDSEEISYLWDLIDPYTYIPRFVDLPKLVMSMTGDEFFVLDSSRFWMERMKSEGGEVWNTMHPDADHSSVTGLPSLIPSLAGWVRVVAGGGVNPNVDWTMDYERARIVLTIPSEFAGIGRTVEMWTSHTCNKLSGHGAGARRDFRMIDNDMASVGECSCGVKLDDEKCFNLRASVWKNETLAGEGQGEGGVFVVDMADEVPGKWENRWLGFFITVTFHDVVGEGEGEVEGFLPKVEPGDLRLSSQVMVLPDYVPYDCYGEECAGDIL